MKNIKWDRIISMLALIISLISLFFSFRVEKSRSSPNVQVQFASGGKTMESGQTRDSVTISSTIVLLNVGNAPTQIVNVKWEVAASTETNYSGLLAISDTWNPSDVEHKKYFESIRSSPVQGIKKTTIEPNKTLTLNLFFRSAPFLKNDTTLQNIRVLITFSNGQQLTILPELLYFRRTPQFQN